MLAITRFRLRRIRSTCALFALLQPLKLCSLMASLAWIASAGLIAAEPSEIEHVKVYAEKGKFGGWPANHGIWSWGDEILVGFSAGTMKDLGAERHNIDREKPEYHWLARSLMAAAPGRSKIPRAKAR